MTGLIWAGTVALSLVRVATPAAQGAPEPGTRAELLRQARQEKAGKLTPMAPDALERAMDLAEGKVLPLLRRDGVYARFGSISTGSGFAFGGGYRDRSLVGRRGALDLWAAGTLRHYWALEGRISYPLAVDRLQVEGYARQYSYPQEDFFGVGPDSRRSDRSNFRLNGGYAGGRVDARPATHLSFDAGLEWQSPRVSDGTSGSLPSTFDLFDDAAVPGLAERADFIRTFASATVDYRQPINARRGGFYRIDFSRYDDRSAGTLSFRRIDVDLRQYVSFLNERRVFAARFWMATTDADGGGRVPFYFMPALGGNDTLRGFRARRFYGPHALLLQGEYRWEIWSGFDAALFYDAGKVALRRGELDFRDLEHDYGFGFRFNTDTGVVMRVDAAFGSRDGKHLHIVFGGIF
jgi:outer membrane protein assembly factor BamA